MAFQIALRNNLPHPFPKTSNTAGRKWLNLFLKRNASQLTIRPPQSLSRARILGFTEENVKSFFNILRAELDKIKFNPARTFNVDETGITTVQSKNVQVICTKGKPAVYKMSSAERGKLNTIVTCMSAVGQYVPPMIVFPRKKKELKLMKGAPPGAISGFHPSGWIQCDLFCQWMKHFASFVKPTAEDPVVLIMDGHYSHTRNLEVINFARENHIIMVCLPPHSTHKMQPLDIAFMKPFKTFYNQETEKWISRNEGRAVTQYEISELMGKAYIRAATMSNALSGFRAAGIYPFNDSVFTEADFLEEVDGPNSRPEPKSDAECTRQLIDDTTRSDPTIFPPITDGQHQTASQDEPPSESHSPSGSISFRSVISPKNIRALPKVQSQSRKRKGGESVVLTSSPYKKKLEDFYIAKSEKHSNPASTSGTAEKTNPAANKKKVKGRKRKVSSSSDSEDSNEPPLMDTDDDLDMNLDDPDSVDATCAFCKEKFSDDCSGQQWVMCSSCFNWNHQFCDAASGEGKQYTCSYCLND